MKRLSVILGTLFFVMALSSPAQANTPAAHLRLIYAVPDGPTVDIWLGNQRLFEQVKFTDITDYLPIPPQAQTLKIISGDSLLLETTLKTEANQNYTLAVAGKLILLETVLLKDDTHTPAPGMVQLRVVHLSPNTPTLDVLGKNGVEATLFNEVAFKEAAHYIPLHAGQYDFTLQVADTAVTALKASPLALAEGQIYSLFVIGLAGSKSDLQLLNHADAVATTAKANRKTAPIAAAVTQPQPQSPTVAESAMFTHKTQNQPTRQTSAKSIPTTLTDIAPEAMPVTGADEIVIKVAPTPLPLPVATTVTPTSTATIPTMISLLVIISTLMVGAKTLQKDPRQARQREPQPAPQPKLQ